MTATSPAPAAFEPAETGSKRCSEIDGLRGWAALCVVLFHLVWETFGVRHPEYRAPVVRALLDGRLAVYVFFVLSGDALSIAFTSPAGKGPSARMVLKRYFRLAGPVLFSCAVVFLLMRFGLTFNAAAGPIVGRPDWLGAWLQFPPSFSGMLKYSLLDVFTNHRAELSYNPFLWPMGIELAGSMLIFCLAIVYRELRNPATVVLSGAIFLTVLGSLYALFLVGVWFGMLRAGGLFSRLQKKRRLNCLVSLLALAILFVILAQSRYFHSPPARIVLASVVVSVCYSSVDLLAFMRSRLSRFLGRISFPLYFMQLPVLVSWTSWCIVYGNAHPESIWASAPAVVISSMILIVVVATITERLEGRYLSWIDSMLTRNLLRKPTRRTLHPGAADVAGDGADQARRAPART